jgi:hypothetical protein
MFHDEVARDCSEQWQASVHVCALPMVKTASNKETNNQAVCLCAQLCCCKVIKQLIYETKQEWRNKTVSTSTTVSIPIMVRRPASPTSVILRHGTHCVTTVSYTVTTTTAPKITSTLFRTDRPSTSWTAILKHETQHTPSLLSSHSIQFNHITLHYITSCTRPDEADCSTHGKLPSHRCHGCLQKRQQNIVTIRSVSIKFKDTQRHGGDS